MRHVLAPSKYVVSFSCEGSPLWSLLPRDAGLWPHDHGELKKISGGQKRMLACKASTATHVHTSCSIVAREQENASRYTQTLLHATETKGTRG